MMNTLKKLNLPSFLLGGIVGLILYELFGLWVPFAFSFTAMSVWLGWGDGPRRYYRIKDVLRRHVQAWVAK